MGQAVEKEKKVMQVTHDTGCADIIYDLSKRAQTMVSKDQQKMVDTFVNYFYTNPNPEYFEKASPDEVAKALVDLWNFFYVRQEGTPHLRVFRWSPQEDQAFAERLVIDISSHNMAFLVDSILGLLERLGTKPRLLFHPIYQVKRDGKGQIIDLAPPSAQSARDTQESFIHCELVEGVSDELLKTLEEELPKVLEDIAFANQDWMSMRKQALSCMDEIQGAAFYKGKADEQQSLLDFLAWIEDGHFTFLGYCLYKLDAHNFQKPFERNPNSQALGILRKESVYRLQQLFEGIAVSKETLSYIFEPTPVIINKTSSISNVHRTVPMDSIGIRQFDKDGNVVGLHIFVGLFTSVAYDSSARDIPLLKDKVLKIVEKSGFDPNWHDGKALIHILDSLPRDELFQATIQELKEIGLAILRLQERPRVAFFLRRDIFDRFLSCLVYIPRDRFDSDLCERIGKILAKEFNGEVGQYKAQFGSLAFARVHYTIAANHGFEHNYNLKNIEDKLIFEARSWVDDFKSRVTQVYEEVEGAQIYRRYRDGFSRPYQDRFQIQDAIDDLPELEKVVASGELSIRVYPHLIQSDERIKIKIYSPNVQLALSDVLPILENLGVRVVSEIPFRVNPAEYEGAVWIHDFELELPHKIANIKAFHTNFAETFMRVFKGHVENDHFNRLVSNAGIDCRQISIMRAYAQYLRQLTLPFSTNYMSGTLINNPGITEKLVALFEKRFDPKNPQDGEELVKDIQKDLTDVSQADEDRILRSYLNGIQSTLRTNYYQVGEDGQPKPYLSIKFNSRQVEDIPLPKPMFEIFVSSPRLEGIHLRGGRVARGGIRWSDRQEDFRTEILGLMKAQMVKNTVIVPVGSKGGFVLKASMAGKSREEIQQEGIACYSIFIQGLLDITDNHVDGKVVRPKDCYCWDEEDPYLVVAADKGTATFSDIANAISIQNNFWLGDAFASGGSAGYDHKKMAITARGAWESVKRHFRELGKDTQTEEFTVLGVGDMSGDVFGNAMLLSPHIRLIAAFNHQHIFIDPNPDAAKSIAERKRLFNLPRSTWEDYDPALISKGGGVWSRQLKTIALSEEIKNLLNIREDEIKPHDLIRKLLTMEVELLFFGGIGTFVKSSFESNVDVGDRANDILRVNGKDLNCRVIGEGANLGVTQRGRMEFDRLKDGYINTDFVDNSAGVATSDREVNIKILFNEVIAQNQINIEERNKILVQMTDDVAQLVLQDNYIQPQAITLTEKLGHRKLDQQVALMKVFEHEGLLNRAIEFLPDDAQLEEYQSKGMALSRPEIAVLQSYSKIDYYEKILKTQLPDDKYFQYVLLNYFPPLLQEKFKEQILKHPLRREIISTYIVNQVINRNGATFIYESMESTGASLERVIQAFFAIKKVFDLKNLWRSIDLLDNTVLDSAQMRAHVDIYQSMRRTIFWVTRYFPMSDNIDETINVLKSGIGAFLESIHSVLDEEGLKAYAAKVEEYVYIGLPKAIAERLTMVSVVASSPDTILIAAETGFSVPEVASLYFKVGSVMHFKKIRELAERHSLAKNFWERAHVHGLMEELYGYQADVVEQILSFGRTKQLDMKDGGDVMVDQWSIAHRPILDRIEHMMGDAQFKANPDLSMLSVLTREMRILSGA